VSGEAWPAGDVRLERRYRRLLLAYSGRYRRRHGTEIVTTLLEMAEPGRSRPSAAEAWHLVAGGVRQRFRLPAGRPFVLAAAVLVTVVTAVCGAVAGSWAGERTFAPLPPQAAAQRLQKAVVEDPETPPLRHSEPGEADYFQFLGRPAGRHPAASAAAVVQQTRDRLVAAGWTITRLTGMPPTHSLEKGASYVGAWFTAERDGLVLNGTMVYSPGDDSTIYSEGFTANLFARRTGAYLPVTVAGSVLGALAGWMLVAALAYRSHRRRAVALSTGMALAAAGPPVFAVVHNAIQLGLYFTDTRFPVYTLHSVFRSEAGPGSYSPIWFLAAAAAVGVLAVACSLGPATAEPQSLAGPI
jgi:hypothetical protein